jgi:pyruvate dehydrogenase E2 component (dihydrolipoamide acetyltransferase)
VVIGMTRMREFALPDLGEGLTEGEIIKWLVAEGDLVELNQPIVEVETAKAAVEIPAKWPGRVVRIHHPEGATVAVGTPIIVIDTEPDAGDPPSVPDSASGPAVAGPSAPAQGGPGESAERISVLVGYGPRTATPARRRRVTAERASQRGTSEERSGAGRAELAERPSGSAEQSTVENGRRAPSTVEVPASATPVQAPAPAGPPLAKPPVRKLARDLGVDLRTVAGTGPGGTITRDDVYAAARAASQPELLTGPEFSTEIAPRPATVAVFGPNREHRVPVRGVRKLMAQNMVASAFTAPHVTEFLTVDVTRSMRALARLREHPDWQGVRLSPLLFVAKAALLAIRRHPMINSTWSEETDEIIVKEYVNLGIAAATPRGLIVPNIKDAGRLSLRELADALTALVTAAKEGRTAPADMTGGTFTITNVGVFGIDAGTPILPPGEAAILAFGAVRPTPWVYKGKVRVRDVTTLALSFDHRIIDGELGALFLRDVGAFLSDPETTLLAWA